MGATGRGIGVIGVLLQGLLGSAIGGWVWPLINDFADGFDSPNAGAGCLHNDHGCWRGREWAIGGLFCT